MPDREKVSIGLMDISDYFSEIYRRSNEREEFELALDRRNIIEDALALLKEQEARVMNVKEVRESVGNPMWFESRGKYLGEKGWWCLSLGGDPSFHIRISTSKANGPITLSLTDYNKVWRCWTAKPFPEQMQETPWEGEKD